MPGREQVASLRRGPGSAGRGTVRATSRRATVLSIPTRTRWGTSRPASIKRSRADFLHRGHIDAKYDCHTCWARPLCAGGCHHEAFVRYGDTGHPESALLRLDSGLDRHLSQNLRRDRGQESGVSCNSLPKGKHHETHASVEQEGRGASTITLSARTEDVVAMQDRRQPSSAPTFRWDAR